MPVDLPNLYQWLHDTTPTVLYGAFVVWLLSKLKQYILAAVKQAPRFIRRRQRKRLRKFIIQFREIEHDSALLSYQINRSGVYLTLFWLCALGWFMAYLMLFLNSVQVSENYRVQQLLGSLPMYAFEIAWLKKTYFVSDVFKRRRRLANRHQHSEIAREERK